MTHLGTHVHGAATEAVEDVVSRESRGLPTRSVESQAVATVVREGSAPIPPATTMEVHSSPVAASVPTVQRTYELFGVAAQGGGPVPLLTALQPNGKVLRAGMRLLVGDAPDDGFGLAGTPGRWRDFYGDRSPAEFGQDAERALMYWEPAEGPGRGMALTADRLVALFGQDWREKLF